MFFGVQGGAQGGAQGGLRKNCTEVAQSRPFGTHGGRNSVAFQMINKPNPFPRTPQYKTRPLQQMFAFPDSQPEIRFLRIIISLNFMRHICFIAFFDFPFIHPPRRGAGQFKSNPPGNGQRAGGYCFGMQSRVSH